MQCILCKSDEINDLELGEIKVWKDIHVHYFCMLTSPSLLTRGSEDDGILGFLPSDIIKESRRAARLKCHYCHQMGATIGCCNAMCNRSFHLNCGLKNNCLNQFNDKFLSFCDRHVVKRKGNYTPEHVCIICHMEMGEYEKTKAIFTPCCKSEWFHKMCLMRLANSAGYFFKCPKCNDVEKFTEECMKSGIYIPQRDAAWETEENAFEELMERPNTCVAVNCLNLEGRNSDTQSNELLICETCGSNCMHENCWQRNEPYYCCLPINPTAARNDSISEDTTSSLNTVALTNPESKNQNNCNENRTVRGESYQNESTNKNKRKLSKNVDDDTSRSHKMRKQSISFENETIKQLRKENKNSVRKRSRQIVDVSHEASSTIQHDFPITKIRNGSFSMLRCKPMILLAPLSPGKLKMLRNDDCVKKEDPPGRSKKLSFEFAIISPKKSGKTFKNYTITSFFKPLN